jgi:hypothetical protein
MSLPSSIFDVRLRTSPQLVPQSVRSRRPDPVPAEAPGLCLLYVSDSRGEKREVKIDICVSAKFALFFSEKLCR